MWKSYELHYQSLWDKYTWKVKLYPHFKTHLHKNSQMYGSVMIKYTVMKWERNFLKLNEKECQVKNVADDKEAFSA